MVDPVLGIRGGNAFDPILALAYQIGAAMGHVALLQQLMTLFIAKMRHINHRGGIIGQ